MARFVCHQADWGAMATIAARQPVVGFPFANVFSLSDGPVGDSRGTPYIYATPLGTRTFLYLKITFYNLIFDRDQHA